MKRPLRFTATTALAGGALALAAVLGCNTNGMNSAKALLGPGGMSTSGSTTGPSLAQISFPFASSNFVATVDNPLYPLPLGRKWTYRTATDAGVEINTVEVTNDKKEILGVKVVVVLDQVFLNGQLTESTFDWFAQDKSGNVWYLGEDTKTLSGGVVVSTQGSWEAGKGGAKAGIIMLANPKIGDQYYQEFAPGIVADQGKVMSLDENVVVPYGSFEHCVETAEWTPIEPGDRAHKFYVRGIGPVLELSHRQGGERVELVDFKP